MRLVLPSLLLLCVETRLNRLYFEVRTKKLICILTLHRTFILYDLSKIWRDQIIGKIGEIVEIAPGVIMTPKIPT